MARLADRARDPLLRAFIEFNTPDARVIWINALDISVVAPVEPPSDLGENHIGTYAIDCRNGRSYHVQHSLTAIFEKMQQALAGMYDDIP